MPRACRFLTLLLIAPAALLSGCGNARTPVPSLTQPANPHGFRKVTYRRAGIAFTVPDNWLTAGGRAPLLGTITSGTAVIAVWGYVDTGQQPSSQGQLEQARKALIGAARARDPSMTVLSARITTVAGVPAVVLNATEQVNHQTRQVRSIHMFGGGVEVVIDQYAPPSLFVALDRAVFAPLRRSLTRVPTGAT